MSVQTRRTTEPFREEHVEIRKHLDHMSEMVGSMSSTTEADRGNTMRRLVSALRSHIVPHARWEEEVLYPVVDEKAGGGAHPFTAAMRHEHEIVGRWIEQLEKQANNPAPDPVLFARRADQLLGLILAHFEDEEEVLLPVLDATMSSDEFEREIASKGNPHPK